MAYASQKYEEFQLIAYETPTLSPESPGIVRAPPVASVPVPAMDDADAERRLRRLAYVVDLARKKVEAKDDSNKRLKIFMVPEFFFRPNAGVSNSYDLPTGGAIVKALQGMFTDAKYRHWLFVIGSIIYNEEGNGQKVFWNTAVIVKGGTDDADQPFQFVDKRYISGIDGLPQGNAALNHPYLNVDSWEKRKRSVGQIDNVAFGIEICLDHGLGYGGGQRGYLRDVAVEYKVRHGVHPVKLHFLTACGMPLRPESVAAYEKGYVLRVDGHVGNQPKPAGWGTPLSEVQKVTAQDFRGNVTLGGATAESWSEAIPMAYQAVDTMVLKAGMNRITQRIVAYDPLPL